MIERFQGGKLPAKMIHTIGIGALVASASFGCFETKRPTTVGTQAPIATPTIDGGYYPTRQADLQSPEVLNLLNWETMQYEEAVQIETRLSRYPTNQVALPVPFPNGYPVAIFDRIDQDNRKFIGARIIRGGSMFAPLTGFMREVMPNPGIEGRLFELAPDNRQFILTFRVGGKIETNGISFDSRRVRMGENVMTFIDPKVIDNSTDEIIIRALPKVDSPTYKPEISRDSLLQEKAKFLTFKSPDTPQ